MKRAIRLCATIVIAVVPAIAVASSAAGEPARVFEIPAPAMSGPAAYQCEKLGGISRLADGTIWGGDQIALCHLDDDGVIGQWSLFQASMGESSRAVLAFLSGRWTPMTGAIETWADRACASAGGIVSEYTEHLRPSDAVRTCDFSDGSRVEVWTMFGGPDLYPRLARMLEPAGSSATAARSETPGLETPASDIRFWHCPWPRTCMAPCQQDPPPQVLCLYTNGELELTSFACCCCGSGVNSYAPLLRRATVRGDESP